MQVGGFEVHREACPETWSLQMQQSFFQRGDIIPTLWNPDGHASSPNLISYQHRGRPSARQVSPFHSITALDIRSRAGKHFLAYWTMGFSDQFMNEAQIGSEFPSGKISYCIPEPSGLELFSGPRRLYRNFGAEGGSRLRRGFDSQSSTH